MLAVLVFPLVQEILTPQVLQDGVFSVIHHREMLFVDVELAHREWDVAEAHEEVFVDMSDERLNAGHEDHVAHVELDLSARVRSVEQNRLLDVFLDNFRACLCQADDVRQIAGDVSVETSGQVERFDDQVVVESLGLAVLEVADELLELSFEIVSRRQPNWISFQTRLVVMSSDRPTTDNCQQVLDGYDVLERF